MRNKFTKSASKALDNSLNVAKSFGHNYVGTEHLLIALVKTIILSSMYRVWH